MSSDRPPVYRYVDPTNGWFVAFMDEVGFVCIQSDYGDYAYRWGNRGEGVGIRQFLLGCDTNYLLRKFAPAKVIDEVETKKAIFEAINELPKNRASEMEHLGRSSFESEVSRYEWYCATKLSDAGELFRYRAAPQAVAFFERVWPRLRALMQSDVGGAAR